MRLKNNDQRTSLFWGGLGLAIVLYSKKYGLGTPSEPGPGFVPFLTGLSIILLAGVVFLQQIPQKRKDDFMDLWLQKRWSNTLIVMGALILFALFLKTLGFLLASFLLIAFLFRIIEPLDWEKVLIGAFLTSLGSYLVFNLWLEAQLPKGIFGF